METCEYWRDSTSVASARQSAVLASSREVSVCDNLMRLRVLRTTVAHHRLKLRRTVWSQGFRSLLSALSNLPPVPAERAAVSPPLSVTAYICVQNRKQLQFYDQIGPPLLVLWQKLIITLPRAAKNFHCRSKGTFSFNATVLARQEPA